MNFSPTKCMDRQAISLTTASAALSNDWYCRHLFYSSSCSAGMLTCRRPDRKAWTDLTYCHHRLRRSSMWRTSSGTTMMCLNIFLTLSYIHDAHSLTHYITHYITSQQGARKEDPRDGRRAAAEHGLQAADPVSEVSSPRMHVNLNLSIILSLL